jgi:hypothetical protein
MAAPPGPVRSPDGLWWWDGNAWQPIATLAVPPTLPLAPQAAAASPVPAAAPPVSEAWQPPPAGPVVGGGAWTPTAAETWQPPAATPPAAAATAPTVVPPPPPPARPPVPPKEEVQWPTWLPQSAAAEAVVQGVPSRVEHTAATAAPPSPSAATAPRPPVALPGEGRVSSWASQFQPAVGNLTSNRQVLIWAGVAILGLVAIYVTYQVLANSNLFGGNGGTPPDLGPSGTQAQQADAFLGSLNPALDSTASAFRPIAVDCGGTHSVTCRSSLEDADSATLKAIAVIDNKAFPNCLAATVVQARHDLVNIEQALKTAVIGFHSNSDDLTTRGLKDFTAVSAALKTDQDALKAAGQASCPKGP